MPQEINKPKLQNAILENCEKLRLSGINKVISFDEEALSLETELGRLEIRGRGMHIDSFDTAAGDMSVSGYIYALVFSDNNSRKGFLKRVFS